MFRIVLAFGLVCVLLCGCDDDEPSAPATGGPLDGTWELTLAPVDSLDTPAALTDEVYLYESGGLLAGYAPYFTYSGTRDGDTVDLEVNHTGSDV